MLPPPLHEIARALERDPCHLQPCLGQFIPAASKAPFTASTLGVGRSVGAPRLSSPLLSSLCCCRVFKGWALSLCLFLLRLSLLMTPPFVPTPHLSVSQELRSPAEEPEPERPATRASAAAGMRAGSLENRRCRSGCGFKPCQTVYSCHVAAVESGGRHPCHLNDVTQQAN